MNTPINAETLVSWSCESVWCQPLRLYAVPSGRGHTEKRRSLFCCQSPCSGKVSDAFESSRSKPLPVVFFRKGLKGSRGTET